MTDSQNNRQPQFLDIESNSYDDDSFPTCIAWSLPDGQIKNVLIMPDEDWNPQDSIIEEELLQHLYDHGVSGIDIIRELNDDLDGKPVYIDGIDYDVELLEKLFDTFDEEPTFELTSITSLLTNNSLESIMDSKNGIMQDNNLDVKNAEHNVLSLLILARENELI